MEKSRKYSIQAIEDIGRLSADGIIVYDISDDRVEYCNAALARIFELPRTAILNASCEVLRKCIKEDNQFFESQVRQLITDQKVSNVELRLKSKDDKYISCDLYLIKDKNVAVGLIKDTTRAKQHFNYITEFGARKDAILDLVAHNLSGPLNLTNRLLDSVDQLSQLMRNKRIDSYTYMIRENTQQCIEIINSFLKEEHLESERVFVKHNRYDVVAKIKVVLDWLEAFNSNKQIKFIAPKELFVSGDDVKFFQVIHNLVSNAFKFTGNNGKITVKVEVRDKTFIVYVKDNGIGIPEYMQPHVFKKNTPAAREGLKGEKSIGMGLYIVKKLVGLMKGKIELESEENKGTCFSVELPREVVNSH